jgi:acyl carrier protein
MAEEAKVKDVLAIIAEQLGLDISEVTEEKSFIEDLNADSLDLTELIMTLEEKFNVEISDQQAEQMKTVKDVVGFVTSAKAK